MLDLINNAMAVPKAMKALGSLNNLVNSLNSEQKESLFAAVGEGIPSIVKLMNFDVTDANGNPDAFTKHVQEVVDALRSGEITIQDSVTALATNARVWKAVQAKLQPQRMPHAVECNECGSLVLLQE